MKLGRNDPCPCGSGKKYKRCCMDSASKQHAEVFDDVEAMLAMNPNLTVDELNVVLQHKVQDRNNSPHPDFCGLSPNQMTNWLYAPFAEKELVEINVPSDISASPVMRYLQVILDEAMENGGKFKATAKGNLPIKVVQRANALMPELPISQFSMHIIFNEFTGTNEDKFNALHYTRVIAEIAGIIYRRSGYFHVKKAAQKEYQMHGIQAFFKPMLDATVSQYNWGYLDAYEYDIPLKTFWLFMLWRIKQHQNVEILTDEVITAFPDLLLDIWPDDYSTQDQKLQHMIETRFIHRFLQFWGFISIDPRRRIEGQPVTPLAQIQPLLEDTFTFKF